jgi:proteasome accessory factor C
MADKQASPIAKAARLLDLVPFISTHQGIAVSELAQEFGISENELLADLNTLWMCGLPGYTPLELIDLEFESGYVSIRNAEILQTVRVLTKDELVVLLVGLDLLAKSIDRVREDLLKAVSGLQIKIKKIVGDVATISPTVDSSHRAVILQAISSRKDLRLTYHSVIRDEFTDRHITPLELQVDQGVEVLQAYCHEANAYRTFRVENISTIALSKSQEAATIKNIAPENFQVSISIKSRLRATLERFRIEISPELTMNSGQFVATSFSQDWLIRNSLSTLAGVEVLSPESTRSELAARCRKSLALYANPLLGS